MRGFTRYAFPYTDLSKIDELLRVTGFIAGVTNPHFANKPEWWDVLCDIGTGRIKISPKIQIAPPSTSHSFFGPSISHQPDTGDNAFMNEIISAIQSRFGEKVIRQRFHAYISRFVRLAAAYEESVYGSTCLLSLPITDDDNGEPLGLRGHGHVWPDEGSRVRDLQANMSRIEGWLGTRSYYAYAEDVRRLGREGPVVNVDLRHQIDRLRVLRLSAEEAGRIFVALNKFVQSYEEITQFLAVVPEAQGGLHHVALGLFHPDRAVRREVVQFLTRVRGHVAGKHFWGGLSRWYKVAFLRIVEEGEREEGG